MYHIWHKVSICVCSLQSSLGPRFWTIRNSAIAISPQVCINLPLWYTLNSICYGERFSISLQNTWKICPSPLTTSSYGNHCFKLQNIGEVGPLPDIIWHPDPQAQLSAGGVWKNFFHTKYLWTELSMSPPYGYIFAKKSSSNWKLWRCWTSSCGENDDRHLFYHSRQ